MNTTKTVIDRRHTVGDTIKAVSEALENGSDIQIQIASVRSASFNYIRVLYAHGIIDRVPDEWVGVLTFARKDLANR